ncbi:MAG: dihydrofolate reductase, partial [bacterium]|nr:dihydrofolate reductase [bacterium]
MISIIAAVAKNRIIGKNNQLPWHLPEDLKHFKEITMGHPILMGRKTFESIGHPLPGRENIVLTRDRSWKAEGVTVIHDFEAILKQRVATEENFVIGGSKIYELALPYAQKLYLTLINKEFEG